MTKLILGAMILGILCGCFLVEPAYLSNFEHIADYALALLMFTVGLDLGRNKELGKQVVALPKFALAIPFLIAVGSLIGVLVMNIFMGLHPLEAAAVGSGFGWYSLSGVLIAQTYDISLGALAFLTNIFREVMAIVVIPWTAAKFGNWAAVAPGGATAMDVTLPLISQNTNQQTTIIAFYSGTVLSLSVPVLVTLILKWANLLL